MPRSRLGCSPRALAKTLGQRGLADLQRVSTLIVAVLLD
jgi:hypothetical protein